MKPNETVLLPPPESPQGLLPPPQSRRQALTRMMKASVKVERHEVATLRATAIDLLRVTAFLLPVLLPGVWAFAYRDAVLAWVDRVPMWGGLALLGSFVVLFAQFRLVPRMHVGAAWVRLRTQGAELLDYLLLNRFGTTLFLLQAATFLTVPQGTETLRTLFEQHRSGGWSILRLGFFWLSLLLLSVSQWYGARRLLDQYRKPNNPHSTILLHLPRLLGVGVPLIMGLAMHQASLAYLHEPAAWRFWLGPLPMLLVVIAGPRLMPVTLIGLFLLYSSYYAVFGFLVSGHPPLKSPWHTLNYSALICTLMAWSLSMAFSMRRRWLEETEGLIPTDRLGPPWYVRSFRNCFSPRHYLFSILLFAGLVAFMTLNQDLPVILGSAALFLFAAGTFTRIGAALAHFAEEKHFPVYTVMTAALVGFGLINDNHPVRQIRKLEPIPPIASNIREFVGSWLNGALDRCPEAQETGVLPVFLFAAEGGGVRAAYWTASVLSGLQDRNPCLAGLTLALSGVSGGALGSAVYAAQVAQRHALPIAGGAPSLDADPNPECRDFDWQYRRGYLPCSRAVLGADFLSPALGTMLYPDLLQRLMPFPVAFFDRATALEKSFENSWKRAMGTRLFEAPFDSLWRLTASPHEVPALFLNGTWVENGWRIVASPIATDTGDRSAAEDLRRFVDHPLRLSTAAHLSARFTYVSPAGTLHRYDSLTHRNRISGHVVDGGYFENSGTATLIELLDGLRDTLEHLDYRWVDSRGRIFRVAPHVGIIRFQGKIPRGERLFPDLRAPAPQTFLVESSAPFNALLKTRNARGEQSVRAVKNRIDRMRLRQNPNAKSHFLEFTLRDEGGPLPLGWSLSSAAQEEINGQLLRLLDSSDVGKQVTSIIP